MSASHKLKNWVNYKFVLKICKEKKRKKVENSSHALINLAQSYWVRNNFLYSQEASPHLPAFLLHCVQTPLLAFSPRLHPTPLQVHLWECQEHIFLFHKGTFPKLFAKNPNARSRGFGFLFFFFNCIIYIL